MRDLLVEAINQDDEYPDAYYVLGILYRSVPGVISFGNTDFAVSLGRLAVDLHEDERRRGVEDEYQHGFYIDLAEHLIARNWNAQRRTRQQESKQRRFDRADTPLDRGFNYEGTISIPQQSDREEAATILRDVIRRLEAISAPTAVDTRLLRNARELLEGI